MEAWLHVTTCVEKRVHLVHVESKCTRSGLGFRHDRGVASKYMFIFYFKFLQVKCTSAPVHNLYMTHVVPVHVPVLPVQYVHSEHSPISMAIMPPKLELRTPRGHRNGERLPEIQLP